MIIYYNPACSKCRYAKQFLDDNNKEYEIVEYLKVPMKKEEMARVLEKLNMEPIDIIRKNEEEFKQFFDKKYSRDEWIKILIEHPKLIQRPIIVNGDKAVLGRYEEKLKEIL